MINGLARYLLHPDYNTLGYHDNVVVVGDGGGQVYYIGKYWLFLCWQRHRVI